MWAGIHGEWSQHDAIDRSEDREPLRLIAKHGLLPAKIGMNGPRRGDLGKQDRILLRSNRRGGQMRCNFLDTAGETFELKLHVLIAELSQ